MRRPKFTVNLRVTFQSSCNQGSYVLYAISLIRFLEDSVYPWLRLPVTRSAYSLPKLCELFDQTCNKPLVSSLAGWALRIHSQKKPPLMVCVPTTLVTVSLRLGMYLSA